MKKLLIIAILGLAGCVVGGVQLTENAKKVRTLGLGGADNCKLISIEELNHAWNGFSPAACARTAHDHMLNKAAELGGNAIIVTNKVIAPCALGGTTINFEVYYCDQY